MVSLDLGFVSPERVSKNIRLKCFILRVGTCSLDAAVMFATACAGRDDDAKIVLTGNGANMVPFWRRHTSRRVNPRRFVDIRPCSDRLNYRCDRCNAVATFAEYQ